MDRRINGGAGVVLVVFVLANGVGVYGQSIYSCWGGCYNGCFIKSESERLGCDYQCLNNCVPSSASDLNYYCQIGCSLKRCIPASNDGAKLESCFGFCTNLCKKLIAP